MLFDAHVAGLEPDAPVESTFALDPRNPRPVVLD